MSKKKAPSILQGKFSLKTMRFKNFFLQSVTLCNTTVNTFWQELEREFIGEHRGV